MLTTDSAIDEKSFYDLQGIYYCLPTKTDMQMKHLASTKFIIFRTNQTMYSTSFFDRSEFAKHYVLVALK